MIKVEDWAEIRRLYKVEGMSKRAISRRLGLHRNTIRRALASEEPLRYKRGKRKSVLDPYKAKIHAILSEDHEISGVRIYEILQQEGYPGKISILRDYLQEARSEYKPREVYIRMVYQPGEYAQIDWGEMPGKVMWGGHQCKVYVFVMILCYSRLMYIEFSLSSGLYDLLRCHQNAIQYFGGIPKICVYDNMKSVVKKRRGKEVTYNETFEQFAGYYTFRPLACWPGSPNQKGVVERPIDYIKKNFWAGRSFADVQDLNNQGRKWLQKTANRRCHRTTRQSPIDHFQEERGYLLKMPAEPFDTDWILYPVVSKDCVIRVQTNDYSVPWKIAQRHRRIEVRVDDCWVRACLEGKEVVRHVRSYGKHQQILDPKHYQGLWQSRKKTAFAHLERGFLTAYGEVGQRFYEGLGRKTDRLSSALKAILKLENQYAHIDILHALKMAVQNHQFDPMTVEYLLRTARLKNEIIPPIKTAVEIPVEERSLNSYDYLMEVTGGGS